MLKKSVALCLAFGAISLASSATAQAQKPAGDKPAQHQHMMQGITDATFVPMMIKHHEQGIEMARLEEERGASASVKALAARIRQSQEKELAELKAHLGHATSAEGAAGHAKGAAGHADHDMEHQGQMMVKRLKSASGADLDHAFLEDMSKHHQMAISMIEGAKLEDPELKKLAQEMVAAQRQELAELKKALGSHPGK